QTSGWSLTEQDPFNNVTRTLIEANAAAMGHTQSLHTNALDEAIALPTDFSARIARNTQLFLQEETLMTNVADTWRGSYYVENLKVEEEAAKRQAQIDSNAEIIIGMNQHQLEEEEPIDILDIDNSVVREKQIERIEKMKAERNEEKVQATLQTLTKAAETGEGN